MRCSRDELDTLLALGGVWLGFALVYGLMHQAHGDHFRFEHPVVDPLYFSATTTTTIGYGDFVPHTPLSRGVVVLHQICTTGLVLLLFCFITKRKGG